MKHLKSIMLVVLTAILTGCSTAKIWMGERSPVKKEYSSGRTYLYGANHDLLVFCETSFTYAAPYLIDLPFSFCADVVLLPASIPLTNRNKKIPFNDKLSIKSSEPTSPTPVD